MAARGGGPTTKIYRITEHGATGGLGIAERWHRRNPATIPGKGTQPLAPPPSDSGRSCVPPRYTQAAQ
jgi:hypothetical protein